MIVVGLTGGIGSGKSFVANEFLKKGVPVYNSDLRAKELMRTDYIIKDKLINKFGSKVFIKGVLNRQLIANQIFNNKQLIEWINKLVHPIVKKDFEDWVRKQNSFFVIKEAAILIESNAYKQCNKIIVVTAPKEICIERVLLRDNLTRIQVGERMANQITDNERLNYADYIINNDGIMVVSEQVNNIYSTILKLK